MYCLIITQPMKRKPPRSRAYRNARCVPAYPGAGYCSIKGEEIERTLKEKYRVVLKESHRIDGRIKTKQWHIITLSYWDIIDDFMLYHKSPDDDVLWIWEGSIEDKVRKHFPNATAHQFQEYCQLISDKLTPIKDGIILEYLHSEEYHVRLENERMKEHYNRQHRKKERQNSSQTGYTYHSFQYHANQVRVFLTEEGEPIWVAKDVCQILGISRHRDAVRRLDADQKSRRVKVDTNRGSREVTTVTESGLWELVLKSKKPEAKAFRKWLTSEVLPQIRKTGSYGQPQLEPGQVTYTYTPDDALKVAWDATNDLNRKIARLERVIDCQDELVNVYKSRNKHLKSENDRLRAGLGSAPTIN